MFSKAVILEVDGLMIAGQLYLPGEGEQTSYPIVLRLPLDLYYWCTAAVTRQWM